jgi:hypothetical protein
MKKEFFTIVATDCPKQHSVSPKQKVNTKERILLQCWQYWQYNVVNINVHNVTVPVCAYMKGLCSQNPVMYAKTGTVTLESLQLIVEQHY